LGDRLGQAVVVENRAGDGGNIASAAAAKAAPDGYTLILMTSGHATNAAMRKDLPFDPVKDFSWISTVTTYPLALSVAPNSPIKTFGDFIAGSKSGKDRYTYTSVGVGTAMHLVGEWIMAESGGSALHVPFKGGSAPVTELLAGRVDVMIDTMTNTAPLYKTDRVRVLASTAPAGVKALPGVASVADTLPGVVYESWLGVAAPPATPAPVVERLNRELRAVLAEPAVSKQLTDWGGSPRAATPAEFRERVAGDITRMSSIVKQRNIQAE
jgi:tripartite-type tricarboxylate transporter receptor subunit TctC